jgi:predicted Ser/Thr protein kinase
MIKGGTLCEKINEHKGEDKYNLGKQYFPGVYEDEDDKNILIKIIQDKGEYKLSKLLEVNGFTPKIYGYFDCNNTVKVPNYTFEQQKIKAYNFSHPKDKKDLGEIKYKTHPKNVKYMVMEKIKGKSLVSSGEDTIIKHMDEIYRLYNILADKGYILGDLAARNIILSDDDKIYFIDFDPTYTIDTLKSIPLSKRMSKEKLQKMLLDELNQYNSYGGKRNRKNKSKKNKSNKIYHKKTRKNY